jgi:short-subunit dehydrogenase
MFLRMGWVETKPRRSPASKKCELAPLPQLLSSLSEALEPFSAVIVTGGSSGIGKSFIELGKKLKPDLPFCNLSRQTPAKNTSGKRLHHVPCDLSRADEVEQGVRQVEAWLPRVSPTGRLLLINNSGFGTYGRFPEPNLARQLEMIDVNARAVVHLTGRLLPRLLERGGAVVTIASTVAFQPTAYAATYGATKAFVLHWSLALNEELRGTGVRTLAVCPGTTATDFFRRAGRQGGTPPGRGAMTAESVVRIALRALAAGRTQVVTGWSNKLYAAAGAKLPKPLAARLAARILRRRWLGENSS